MTDFQDTLNSAGANRGTLRGEDCVLDFGDAAAEFLALQDGCGLVDFSDRTQIEMAGEDSPAFLHNLCTNDIKALVSGSGCEVFLTNVQGKIIGHGYVYRTPGSCIYETIPGQSETLIAYLDRYLFREKVQLIDRSTNWAEVVITGAKAEQVLAELGVTALPAKNFDHALVGISGQPCAVRNVDFVAGPCFQLSTPRETLANLWSVLTAAGATPCGAFAWEQSRILQGTPLFGVDISDENLPQEVARDKSAISFTKGCYIGQETVARIDALGHVNKTLCGVRVSGAAPAAGTELFAAEDGEQKKPVGKVTSAITVPSTTKKAEQCNSIALGYIRRGSNSSRTNLAGKDFTAQVVALPFEA